MRRREKWRSCERYILEYLSKKDFGTCNYVFILLRPDKRIYGSKSFVFWYAEY